MVTGAALVTKDVVERVGEVGGSGVDTVLEAAIVHVRHDEPSVGGLPIDGRGAHKVGGVAGGVVGAVPSYPVAAAWKRSHIFMNTSLCNFLFSGPIYGQNTLLGTRKYPLCESKKLATLCITQCRPL